MKKIIVFILSGFIFLTGCQSKEENKKNDNKEILEIKKIELDETESSTSDFLYAKQDGGIVIRSYNGNDAQVIVPVNTEDYEGEYNNYLQAYQKLGINNIELVRFRKTYGFIYTEIKIKYIITYKIYLYGYI